MPPSRPVPLRLLLIEDCDNDARAIAGALRETSLQNHELTRCELYREALEKAEMGDWDLLILDTSLPDAPEPEAAFDDLQHRLPATPIITVSGSTDEGIAQRFLQRGAHAFLAKERIEPYIFGAFIQSALATRTLQANLIRQSAELQLLVANLNDAIIVINPEGAICYANHAAEQLFDRSYTELVGQQFGAPLTGQSSVELDIILPGGSTIAADMRVSDLIWNGESCRVASLRDISDRKKAEAERLDLEIQLQGFQKMESLGVLARGVAHDFNNLLAAIQAHAEILKLDLDGREDSLESIADVLEATNHGKALCRQLLDYAGRGKLITSAFSLNSVIEGNDQLLKTSLRKDAHLRFELAPHLPPIWADPTQITQLIVNMVINASEAMEDPGGTIVLRTAVHSADEAALKDAQIAPTDLSEAYVCLEVEDNGRGMSEETIRRITEPFYSTKGDGRGLGLSTAVGIIQSHKGALRIQSRVNEGTRMTISFPAADPAALNPESYDGRVDSSWSTSGKALIVESDDTTTGTAARLLQHVGFEVEQARSAQQAAEILAYNGAPFDLVVTSSAETAELHREVGNKHRYHADHVKVLVLTDSPEANSDPMLFDGNFQAFLQKPIRAEAFLSKVKAVMTG